MCGIALIRLKQPIEYYINKYGSAMYGINKMSMMMQKMTNRGQDGAGLSVVKIGVPEGNRYIARYRSIDKDPISHIFEKVNKKYSKKIKSNKDKKNDIKWLKDNVPSVGEVILGHLRYGTHGENSIETCHPFLRQNNWKSRNLVLAGNFNMTNVDEQFNRLVELGQHPKERRDTVTVLEKIGHFLDEENQRLFNKYKSEYTNREISDLIENEADLLNVIKRSTKDFDGGYNMCGITGYGASFVVRDPNGIRPCFFVDNEEFFIMSSERPAIKLAFGIPYEDIQELKPAHALIIEKDGTVTESQYTDYDTAKTKQCSFERIYFSKVNDPSIYQERKRLGYTMAETVLDSIDWDMIKTNFSYIPNTAETSFLGLIDGINEKLKIKQEKMIEDGVPFKDVRKITPRIDRVITKDAKLRTFITDGKYRDDIVSTTYDTINSVINDNGEDSVVIVDDSIVRGTTMEKSILRILDKLNPKKIVIVSTSPQIRYPDCYGIDMSIMKDFISFRAVIELVNERGLGIILDEVYLKCKKSLTMKDSKIENYVKNIYNIFTTDEITKKITEILKPKNLKADLEIIFQSIEGLNESCPNHLGDWYFTGNYPTKGGVRVVNKAFMNYMEDNNERGY
jgi:amidophosphoribosyltransferase